MISIIMIISTASIWPWLLLRGTPPEFFLKKYLNCIYFAMFQRQTSNTKYQIETHALWCVFITWFSARSRRREAVQYDLRVPVCQPVVHQPPTEMRRLRQLWRQVRGTDGCTRLRQSLRQKWDSHPSRLHPYTPQTHPSHPAKQDGGFIRGTRDSFSGSGRVTVTCAKSSLDLLYSSNTNIPLFFGGGGGKGVCPKCPFNWHWAPFQRNSPAFQIGCVFLGLDFRYNYFRFQWLLATLPVFDYFQIL